MNNDLNEGECEVIVSRAINLPCADGVKPNELSTYAKWSFPWPSVCILWLHRLPCAKVYQLIDVELCSGIIDSRPDESGEEHRQASVQLQTEDPHIGQEGQDVQTGQAEDIRRHHPHQRVTILTSMSIDVAEVERVYKNELCFPEASSNRTDPLESPRSSWIHWIRSALCMTSFR